MHLVNALKKQVVNVRRGLLAISHTNCMFNDIFEEMLTYFPNIFFSSAPTSRSFISRSAREFHTLPPAGPLWQYSTRLASDFRLRLDFDLMSSEHLSSGIFLPLAAWMMMIAFITIKSSLVPLIEGLYTQI